LVTGFSSFTGSAFSTGAASILAGSSVFSYAYSVACGTGSSSFAFSYTGAF
jgi:hypothetical protein